MKKTLITLMVTILLIGLVPISKTSAVGVDTAARVLIGSQGEKVLLAVAEKAGVKFASKTAKDKAIERWNLELFEKMKEAEEYGNQVRLEELQRFQKLVTSEVPTATPIANKPNLGQIAFDSAMFLIGADLIIDTVDSIKGAVATETALNRITDLTKQIEDGEVLVSYGSIGFSKYTIYSSYEGSDLVNLRIGYPTLNRDMGMDTYTIGQSSFPEHSGSLIGVITDVTTQSEADEYIRVYIKISGINVDNNAYITTDSKTFLKPDRVRDRLTASGDTSTHIDDYKTVNYQPLQNEIPEVETGLGWTEQLTGSNPIEIPENIVQEVPLNVPIEGDYPIGDPVSNPDYTPINEPIKDTDLVPEASSPPVTEPSPGEGGLSPVPKPVQPPEGIPNLGLMPFDDLLLVFLKFLLACIMYILRFGEFILTIPLTSPKMLPEPYGSIVEEFKSFGYKGVNAWNLMLTVANACVGFVLFKLLRRWLIP